YMFFVKKGSPQNALQIVGTHPTDQISLSTQITNSFSFGNFKTPFAPPAQTWEKFNWQFVNNEPNQTDKLQLQLNGQTNNAETRLFYTETIVNSSENLDTLNQKLLGYTGVFITAKLTDETKKTPLIPKYLHLLSKPLP